MDNFSGIEREREREREREEGWEGHYIKEKRNLS